MQELVQRWDAALMLTLPDFGADYAPPIVETTGSVLTPGATEAQIAATEQRLGVDLPPFYRQFLSITNGAYGCKELQHDDPFYEGRPAELLAVEDVELLHRRDGDYVGMLCGESVHFTGPLGANWVDGQPGEAAYLAHPGHMPHEGPYEQLYYSIVIGDQGQEGYLALNPMNADAAGEWEVIEAHVEGSIRHRSFRHFLETAITRLEEDRARRTEVEAAQAAAAAAPDPEAEPLPVPVDPPTLTPEMAAEVAEFEAEIEALRNMSHDEMVRLFFGADVPSEAETTAALNAQFQADAAAEQEARATVDDPDPISAVQRLRSVISPMTPHLMFDVAAYDISQAWELLDEHASGRLPLSYMALLTAAQTSSPLLPTRALTMIDRDDGHGLSVEGFAARISLETQQTAAAADALLGLWHDGVYWALRSLARRRDSRVLLNCLTLAGDTDADRALAGVEMLRDLRHPDSTGVLLDIVAANRSADLTTVAAHALAMMRVEQAAEAFRSILPHPDQNVTLLLDRWAGQLEAN